MATISDGTDTITPLLILSSDRAREGRNVILEPIDSPEPYVSLAESRTPKQNLRILFESEAAAMVGLELVSRGRPLMVTTDARSFECVKDGTADIDRSQEVRARWILNVGVREI